MPVTITNRSGDGVHDAMIDSMVVLPDSGSAITVAGSVQAPNLARAAITGSPLAAPAIPGSGSTFWNIQVDAVTGAATVQSSSSGDPAALMSSDGATPQVVIFRQTLVPTSGTALDTDTSTTPDQPV